MLLKHIAAHSTSVCVFVKPNLCKIPLTTTSRLPLSFIRMRGYILHQIAAISEEAIWSLVCKLRRSSLLAFVILYLLYCFSIAVKYIMMVWGKNTKPQFTKSFFSIVMEIVKSSLWFSVIQIHWWPAIAQQLRQMGCDKLTIFPQNTGPSPYPRPKLGHLCFETVPPWFYL